MSEHKKVAILGASGFIGRNLMLNLPMEWKVYAFYNRAVDFPQWLKKQKIDNITLLRKDLSSDYSIDNWCPEHFDLVISLLGNTSHISQDLQPEYDFNSDALAIAGFFKKFSCDRMVYFSSTGVYENHRGLVNYNITKNLIPSSSYGIAKLMSERLIHYFKDKNKIKKFIIVRLSGAYGPYQRPNRLITRLIKKFKIDKISHIALKGTGKNLTDTCVYSSDVVDFILLTEKQSFKNDIIDFSFGYYMTINEYIYRIAEICGINDAIIEWNNENIKECHFFKLGDDFIYFKPAFDFKFKINLEKGVTKLSDWLIKNPEWLPK